MEGVALNDTKFEAHHYELMKAALKYQEAFAFGFMHFAVL